MVIMYTPFLFKIKDSNSHNSTFDQDKKKKLWYMIMCTPFLFKIKDSNSHNATFSILNCVFF